MTTTVQIFDADTVLARQQAVLQALADAGDALPGVTPLPARQLLTSANATWDCEMSYCMLMSVQLGLPEPAALGIQQTGQYTYPQGNQQSWTLTMEVGVVRKISATPTVQGPTQRAPATEKFTADLTGVSSDVAVLVNAAMSLGSRDFQPVPHLVNAVASQGGFHGTAMTITVEAWPAP